MTSFDEQLAQSSPAIPQQTRELDAELARVVAEAERLARPHGRRRGRLIVGSLVVLGALGVGGTAAATGLLPWFDSAPVRGVVTTSEGSQCTLTFGAKPIDDRAAPVSPAARAEATAAAENYLRTLDFAVLAAQARQGSGPRPSLDSESESGAAQTVSEHDVDAVYQLVARRLSVHLDQQGLSSSSVGLSMASSCSGEDQ